VSYRALSGVKAEFAMLFSRKKMSTLSRQSIVRASVAAAVVVLAVAVLMMLRRPDETTTAATAPSEATTVASTLAVSGRTNANVSVVSSGATVVAVWSGALPSGDTDVYAAVSSDEGHSFGTPVRVNSTAGSARVNGEQPPRVALRPGDAATPEIAVVWTAAGTNGTQIMQATSADGGRTFSAASLVPGTDAPGNRGWEAVGAGPGGRFFSVWLDHRKLAPPQQAETAEAHHHGAHTAMSAPTDGVAMAQLSQLYVASLDGALAPQGITGGVCYCCKTAIAAGGENALYLAWRHVYEGNMRDIAFTVSRDGGRTFAAPVRVSEDQWQINGCPDDGPAMAVDPRGTVHIVWPSVVTEQGGPVKALFHSMTSDGRTFTPRERIPTAGQANHPQLAIDSTGTLAVTWDESGSGSRTLAAATGQVENGRVRFTRLTARGPIGTYPALASLGPGRWLRAATVVDQNVSTIRLDTLGR
jgi:hypothetical protein